MHGEYKAPGGKLVSVDLEVEGNTFTSLRISGDFFVEPDEALFRMQKAALRSPADASAAELAGAMRLALHSDDVLMGVTPDAIGIAIRRAVGAAVSWDDLEFEVIRGPSVNPVINVAMDETLVEDVASGKRRPFMRIWEWNAPQIVIGSFQSYENEINAQGIAAHDITVSRRISGGGAMFMEPGNSITYSLVVPTSLVEGLSFEDAYPFLDEWVIEALAKVGVAARFVPLNDIASDLGKIGGAAQKRFANGFLLHHVTLAYDMDAQKMMECLRIGREKIRDKGLRSAAKRVDPMRRQTGLEREQIVGTFLEHFSEKHLAESGEITEEDLHRASQRAAKKFSTPEWVHRIP